MSERRGGVGGVVTRASGRTAKGRRRAKIAGIVVGLLADLDSDGVPQVDYPGNPFGLLPARAVVRVKKDAAGQEVTLMFDEGDPSRPIIMGVLQKPIPTDARAGPLHMRVDGETVTITADNEIVLQCGKATLMLSKEGKVTIRGTYLLSRSSGVNRIQGGSIELN
jgi:hypothetical protein